MSKLPEIPNKRYFTIGEVSTLCAIKPHVLRYWEQEFTTLRPSKRRGNRRYYRHEDVQMVRHIKTLLYDQGYTISGARMQISSGHASQAAPFEPKPHTPDMLEAPAQQTPAPPSLIDELQEIANLLK